MGYRGPGEEPVSFDPDFTPGYHRVVFTRTKDFDDSHLLVMSNKKGQATIWIPDDLAPLSKEEREDPSSRKNPWRFWQLAARCHRNGRDGFPADYWSQEPPREPRNWEATDDLRELVDGAYEICIETGRYWQKGNKEKNQKGRWRASVENFYRVSECPVPLEFGESHVFPDQVVEPPPPGPPKRSTQGQHPIGQDEVPF